MPHRPVAINRILLTNKFKWSNFHKKMFEYYLNQNWILDLRYYWETIEKKLNRPTWDSNFTIATTWWLTKQHKKRLWLRGQIPKHVIVVKWMVMCLLVLGADLIKTCWNLLCDLVDHNYLPRSTTSRFQRIWKMNIANTTAKEIVT